MIDKQASKRNRSFGIVGLCLIIAGGMIVVVPRIARIEKDSTALHVIMGIIYLCLLGKLIFWFKAHYHWSRAKGYSGGLAALALLGFPIAPIVLACFKDQAPAPPPINDPLQKCPHCGAGYRLSEYNSEAEQIYCSNCKGELPKE